MAFDVAAKLLIDWDRDGTYTDESAYFLSARGNHRLVAPRQSVVASSGRVAECSLTMDNSTGRFASLNSGGALYATLGNGKMFQIPMRLQVSVVAAGAGASYSTVFTGFARAPKESTLSPDTPQTVTIDCRGVEDSLLNRRIRTTQANFAAYVDSGLLEDEVMTELIDSTGTGLTYNLDEGLFGIPFPWLNNESVTEELWRLAAANGGRFYGTADGELQYENATHWLTATRSATSQKTFARNTDYRNLDLAWDETELAETVAVSWDEKAVVEESELFNSDFLSVGAGATETLWAELSAPVYEVTTLTSTATTSGGTTLTGVTVTPTYYAQAVKFVISNSNSVQATVRIVLSGRTVATQLTKTAEETSSDVFWTDREGRTRKVSSNRWIQSKAQATMLKDFLVGHQELPSLAIQLTDCVGDPTLRVGDRITVEDSYLYLSSTDFYLTGISWRYNAKSGFLQDLEAIRCVDVYPLVNAPGYFVLDTDVLDGTKVMFY